MVHPASSCFIFKQLRLRFNRIRRSNQSPLPGEGIASRSLLDYEESTRKFLPATDTIFFLLHPGEGSGNMARPESIHPPRR